MQKILTSTRSARQGATYAGRQSALWEYRGFAIYKTQGFWFYHNGEVDQFDITGEPAETLEGAKRAIDRYLSK